MGFDTPKTMATRGKNLRKLYTKPHSSHNVYQNSSLGLAGIFITAKKNLTTLF